MLFRPPPNVDELLTFNRKVGYLFGKLNAFEMSNVYLKSRLKKVFIQFHTFTEKEAPRKTHEGIQFQSNNLPRHSSSSWQAMHMSEVLLLCK